MVHLLPLNLIWNIKYRHKMKNIIKLFAAVAVLFVFSDNASAQPPMGGFRGPQMPGLHGTKDGLTAEQMAARETDRLNQIVGLDAKQYKKIFNFNLKDSKKLINEASNFFGGFGFGGPGGPGPGFGRGFGGPGSFGDEELTSDQKREMEEAKKMAEKHRKAKEKKYRKVLTPEQFNRWQEEMMRNREHGPRNGEPGDHKGWQHGERHDNGERQHRMEHND